MLPFTALGVMLSAKALSEWIKVLSKKRGIKTGVMLAECGLNKNQLATMKGGAYPDLKSIKLLAEYLGVSVPYLLTGAEELSASNVAVGIADSAFVQGANHGTVIVRNGQDQSLSDEASELLRVFESLDVKKRHRLLDLAFTLEDETLQKETLLPGAGN